MKKFLLVLSVALLSQTTIWAYDFSAENDDGITIYYNVTASGECAVTYGGSASTHYRGNVVIPERVSRSVSSTSYSIYRVVGIGERAFSSCTGLTEVTIPSSITEIHYQAFLGCSGLSTVNFDAPNCSISGSGNNSPFKECEQLSIVNISDNVVEIPAYLFYNCSGGQKINIGMGVTTIGNNAFYGCTGVKEINFNATACTSGSFSGCTNLTTVNIGDNVTTIISSIFQGCTMSELTIGESVTSIASSAFSGCTGLTTINFNATNCTTAGSASSPVFNKCTNITNVNIGDYVTTIPDYLFYNCSGVQEVNIGMGVTTIGNNAFYGCTGVKEINFNATACTSGSFSSCTNLTTVNIGDNVTTLVDYLFKGCPNITELTVKNFTPPTIYSNTFEDIPPYLEAPMSSLNKYALAPLWSEIPTIYANKDGSVYYPVPIYYEDSVVLNISGSDEDDGAIATKGSSMEITPYKANNLTYGLVMHETEDITSELINNGSYSFSVSEFHKENTIYCYSPQTENIYDITVSSAGEVLNQITVNSINSVYSLKITGDINGTDITAIRKMFNLKLLDISEANVVSGGEQYYDNYTTSNNKIGKYFFYDMDWLLLVKIPNSVTEIETYAFGNCTGLMTMTIPKNVTSIADHAFSSCTNLTDLTFEDGTSRLSLSSSAYSECPIAIMYIGRNLNYQGSTLPFRNLDTLKSLTIGNRVNSLTDYEFAGCTNLTTLSLGNTITSIGDNAFDGCVSLLEINSKNPTPPELESNTFKDVDKETCILNVPTGSLNDYWLHKYWRDFFNIQEKDFPTSGIDEIAIDGEAEGDGEATEVARYTIDGRQLSASQKGVNIILYSDGSAKKVFVK